MPLGRSAHHPRRQASALALRRVCAMSASAAHGALHRPLDCGAHGFPFAASSAAPLLSSCSRMSLSNVATNPGPSTCAARNRATFTRSALVMPARRCATTAQRRSLCCCRRSRFRLARVTLRPSLPLPLLRLPLSSKRFLAKTKAARLPRKALRASCLRCRWLSAADG